MATYTVDTGIVTAWSGWEEFYSTGAKPSSATISETVDTFDTTPGSSSAFTEQTQGLVSRTVQIEGRLEPAVTAHDAPLVEMTSGNISEALGKSWSMTISRPALEDTNDDGADPVVARTYLPGLTSWSGSFTLHADDSNALKLGQLTDTCTFLIQDDDTTNHTLAGTINLTGANVPVQVGQVATCTYNYQGSGAITVAGSSTITPLWTPGTLSWPDAADLTVTATSGRTYTAEAFITSITINVELGQPITVSMTAQMSGAMTVA